MAYNPAFGWERETDSLQTNSVAERIQTNYGKALRFPVERGRVQDNSLHSIFSSLHIDFCAILFSSAAAPSRFGLLITIRKFRHTQSDIDKPPIRLGFAR